MDRSFPRAALAACVLCALSLAACGGGSSAADAGASAGTPATGTAAVTGVSTPSSVSVVTAKNAQ